MRFGLGGRQEKTQKEVADLMGISQSYISRLEKRIMTAACGGRSPARSMQHRVTDIEIRACKIEDNSNVL